MPLLALGLLIACGAGLSAVVMAELTGQKVRYARSVETATGLPVLAVLPAVHRPSNGEDIVPKGDAYAEAIRALHAGLSILPSRNQRGRLILVTSTAREEGRSTTAIALARSTVQAGLRTLVIDADFTNPRLSRKMGFVSDQLGFSDLLTGRAGFEHVISTDSASTVQIMPAGREYHASPLASPRFQAIMDGIVRAYDAVIIDCAPVSRSTDSHVLARIADQCVYAVRWNSVTREALMDGLRRLAISGMRAGSVGIVMTRSQGAALS
jgi:capsular exopolysaccharide synthesis family protein